MILGVSRYRPKIARLLGASLIAGFSTRPVTCHTPSSTWVPSITP